jgi:hypothetical protein
LRGWRQLEIESQVGVPVMYLRGMHSLECERLAGNRLSVATALKVNTRIIEDYFVSLSGMAYAMSGAGFERPVSIYVERFI